MSKTKPHIHVRGTILYNDGAHYQKDKEWQHQTKAPSVWSIMYEQMFRLQNYKAVSDLDVNYHFDKMADQEFLTIEATPLDDINVTVRLDINSCFCDGTWETKGTPPF